MRTESKHSSKGTKYVNPSNKGGVKNHDLRVAEEDYDPIKHFMEIQQASTMPKENKQGTDLSQMDQQELEEMLANIKE